MFDFTSFKLYAHVINSRGGIQFALIKCRENSTETELCLQSATCPGACLSVSLDFTLLLGKERTWD